MPPGALAQLMGTSHSLDIAVIGAGQAGLSTAFHLRRAGADFAVFDHGTGPGGAWRERWETLTLGVANRVYDLPGMPMAPMPGEVQASKVVADYFSRYERHFELPVRRPVHVSAVDEDPAPGSDRLRVHTSVGDFLVRGLVNATGTWERPFIPRYPGIETFAGRQLHAAAYRRPEDFSGLRVAIIGGGITAVQLVAELSLVTETLWVARREPHFADEDYTPEHGRASVAIVDERVRRGLPPGSVVSVTGLRWTPPLRDARRRGALIAAPIFERITPGGLTWADGRTEDVDVILWATGFRAAFDHLVPLHLRGPGGGIVMDGRLATRVAADHRIHLAGYGPSASTIGANRAGRAAAVELLAHLGLKGAVPDARRRQSMQVTATI